MNNINLTRDELNKIKEEKDLEEFSKSEFDSFLVGNQELLVKGETSELDELEKSEYDTVIEEIRSFAPIEVFEKSEGSNRINKSIVFVRPKQVEWSEELIKSEDSEELVKSKSGTYTDTTLNRKLGRVGQKYGQKAFQEGEDEKK